MLDFFNNISTEKSDYSTQTIVDIILQRAEETPDQVIYTFLQSGTGQHQEITFSQLAHSAKSLSVLMQQRGLTGERILLIVKSNYHFVIAFFACLMAGSVAVPTAVPKRSHLSERLKILIDDAQASAAIVDSDEVGVDAFEQDAFAVFDLRKTDLTNVDTHLWKKTPLSSDSLAFLQYTSGSTGDPKGVMISHGNIIANSIAIQKSFDSSEKYISLIAMPLFHDMGLIGGVIQPMFAGCPTYFMSPAMLVQEPHRWLQYISELKVTVAGGPNFLYELTSQMARPDYLEGIDLSTWRVAYCGAEPIRPATVERFKSVFAPYGFRSEAFFPCFGLAEATLFVTGNPVDRAPRIDMYEDANNKQVAARAIVSCGVVGHETQVLIVDPERRVALADGEQGEIWVRSKGVAQGYWGRPDVTERTFYARIEGDTEDRMFLRTGDMGYMKHHELYVSGRIKDLIILYGQNFVPQDIEHAAEKDHDDLRKDASAAFTVPGDEEDHLVLVLELKRTALRREEDWPAIIQHVRRTVLHAYQLEIFDVVLIKQGSLPKTSSGKVQRRRCRDLYLAGELERVGKAEIVDAHAKKAPTDSSKKVERRRQSLNNRVELTRYLQESLAQSLAVDIDQIDLYKGFFDLGMDSLMAVKFRNQLEKNLGMELPATLLLDFPNAHELVEFLLSKSDNLRINKSSTKEYVNPPLEEPLAVIGMSCRFPGADNPEQFWELLSRGEHAIDLIPDGRWDKEKYYDPDPNAPGKMYVQHGGFIDRVDQFDADFFGISRREAVNLDPQQRLLLEQTWEALEDASIDPDQLKEYETSVFVGIASNDYGQQLMKQGEEGINAYANIGNTASSASGRLSYFLGLKGSAVSIDTACASSLTALHYAAENLNQKESQIAIVAGVNIMLAPEITINCCKANMLSKEGKCRSFDDGADGYVRSEGAGVIILKRLSDAVAAGDNIHAVIRGTSINHNGQTSGFMAPSGIDQQAVIRHALQNAKLKPQDIDYVEAQGTASPLGDPIELTALSDVFNDSHTNQSPLYVGSAKTNIGHLEAAAGMAGLIKVILGLKHQQIPAHLHFDNPNTHLDWSKLPIKIPTALQPWPKNRGSRRAGVSAFGFSGTNAHVIVEEAPENHKEARNEYAHEAPQIIVLSAKNESALKELAKRYAKLYEENPDKWLEIDHETQTRRHHFPQRIAFLSESAQHAHEVLHQFVKGEKVKDLFISKKNSRAAANIAMVFSSEESHYPAMGDALYKNEPAFKEVMDRCNQAFMRIDAQQISLIDILYGEHSSLLQQPAYLQPAMFALEMSLYCLWSSWGVHPHTMFGHGIGRIVAACAARVFSIDDGMKLVCAFASNNEETYKQVATSIFYQEPEHVLVSTVTGKPMQSLSQQAWVDYWTAPDPDLASIPQTECDTYLVIGPDAAHEEKGWLTSISPNMGNEHTMLTSLAYLYTSGVKMNWTNINPYRPSKHVALPAYPFQRQRYWFKKSHAQPHSHKSANTLAHNSAHPLLGERIFLLGSKEIRYQHVLHREDVNDAHGQFIISEEAISTMVWEAARRLPLDQDKLFLHHVNVLQPITISESGQLVQLILHQQDAASYQFSVVSVDVNQLDGVTANDMLGVLHATGEIIESKEVVNTMAFYEILQAAPVEQHYSLMVEHVRKQFIKVMRVNHDDIDEHQAFSEFGMDSLMVAELRNYLNKTLGYSLPITTLIDHPNIDQLSRFLLEHQNTANVVTSNATSTSLQQGEL